MRTPSSVVIASLLVLAAAAPALGGVGVGTTAATPDGEPSTTRIAAQLTDTATQERPAADQVVTRVVLQPNGSAVWEVQFVTRLESQSEVDSYRSFQETFRNDTESFLSAYRDRIVPVVDRAENETGRGMAATNFDASTTIEDSVVDDRFGVVTYRFQWTSFAQTDGDRLVVGDVFAGGFFVGSNQSLIVEAPTDYRIAAVDPAPEMRTERLVRFDGTRDFDDGRPRVVAEPVATATPTETPATTTQPTTTAETTATTATTTADPGEGGGLPILPLIGLLVIALVAVVVAYRAGWIGGPGEGTGGPTTGGGGGAAPPADGGDGGSGGSGATAEPSGEPSDPYEAVLAEIRPPLTDEDRVRKALAENGGRMRQSDIADDLDWSASKTSRVLSDMADDGTVEKLRVGRQNVIDLVVDEE